MRQTNQFLTTDFIYFDCFGVEHIPKEIKTFIGNKNIKTNVFRIQVYYFSIGFIDFMFAGKNLTEFTNLFHQITFKKNNDTILNYFMTNV